MQKPNLGGFVLGVAVMLMGFVLGNVNITPTSSSFNNAKVPVLGILQRNDK